jgi:hypothetical protein
MKLETKNSFTTFAAACRFNSGRHFLDSGDHYGRHYDKPDISPDCNPVAVDVWARAGKEPDISATIETAHFLDSQYEVDFDLQSAFEDWQREREGDYFTLAQEFCEERGLTSQARDNVYNGENDLSQVYIWEVWTEEEKPSDWLYADNSVTVLHVHTGCDVRGGYSSPLFCRTLGEYAVAVDHVAGYRITESHYETDGLDERWQVGYSSWPAGEVRRDIERVFTHTVKGNSFIAKLKSGEVVRISAEMPYCC